MQSARNLFTVSKQDFLALVFSSSRSSGRYCLRDSRSHIALSQHRWISSTSSVASWMDTVKGLFTGKKDESRGKEPDFGDPKSFTLVNYADALKNAKRADSFKQFMVGRSSEVTFSDAFAKQEAVVRFLSGFDPTGENLQTSQKQQAAKHCNCSIADVENALAKFTWAKEAQKMLQKLKEEGKPMPKSMAEVQKLMGSTPLDIARSNLAKSGQISRNALCPCGSKKRYKRCCGKE